MKTGRVAGCVIWVGGLNWGWDGGFMEVLEVVEESVNYGVLSILPVLVVFTVSIITKRTLAAMFCGVIAGSCIIALETSGFSAIPQTFFDFIYKSLGNETYQWITLIVIAFGILTALFEKSGAVMEFGRWIRSFLKTKRQVLLGTFLFGVIVFMDDYLSNLTVGATMRRITDKVRIPRSQLAYIVLLMAGPVSLVIPLSSWTAAFSGVFDDAGVLVNGSAFSAFLSAIPLIFYAWAALAVCLLQILGVIPKFGMIKRDYARAEGTGDTFPAGSPRPAEAAPEEPETGKAAPWNFFIPLVVIIVACLLSGLDILIASSAGVLAALILYIARKKMTLAGALDACFEGVVKMALPLILFVLAWGLNSINDDAGMPAFVIDTVKPLMNGHFLPLIAFLVCSVYAFFTGACWDLAIIIMPIVAPLALAVGADPVFAGAAVFSGALFGNVFCPYGDGVILCAQSCEIRPIDLMFTIAPYMLIAGGVTALLYAVFGFVF
jgi:Na+/H+ antiporter NhaC